MLPGPALWMRWAITSAPGLLPVGGINVPADFRRNNAFKVGGNRSVKIAAWATENSACFLAGGVLDCLQALLHFLLAFVGRHLDKAYAFATALCVVPRVSANFAAHAAARAIPFRAR